MGISTLTLCWRLHTKKRRKGVTMMGIRIGKGAGVQLRMRRSDPDLARGNEAGTGVVDDPAAGKIVAAGVGVEVVRGEDGAGAVTGGGGVEVVRGEDGAGAV